MKTESDAVIVVEAAQIQIARVRRDLSGVIEESGVHEPVDDDAPFRLQYQAVAIAKAPAVVSAQRRSAAERRQHEEWNLLTALRARRRRGGAERQHPRVAQHRYVLNRFVVHLLEPVFARRIGKIAER